MKRVESAFVILLSVLVLALAACGDDDGGATTTQASTTTAAATTTTTAAETTTTAAPSGPPGIPAGHEGRAQCLVCHATGSGGPAVPEAPDHSAFADERAVCAGCHADE